MPNYLLSRPLQRELHRYSSSQNIQPASPHVPCLPLLSIRATLWLISRYSRVKLQSTTPSLTTALPRKYHKRIARNYKTQSSLRRFVGFVRSLLLPNSNTASGLMPLNRSSRCALILAISFSATRRSASTCLQRCSRSTRCSVRAMRWSSRFAMCDLMFFSLSLRMARAWAMLLWGVWTAYVFWSVWLVLVSWGGEGTGMLAATAAAAAVVVVIVTVGARYEARNGTHARWTCSLKVSLESSNARVSSLSWLSGRVTDSCLTDLASAAFASPSNSLHAVFKHSRRPFLTGMGNFSSEMPLFLASSAASFWRK